jgi:hypothetical protein
MNKAGWYGFFIVLLLSWIGGCDFGRGIPTMMTFGSAIIAGVFLHFMHEAQKEEKSAISRIEKWEDDLKYINGRINNIDIDVNSILRKLEDRH